jgi:multidrug efflux pump subunit AcrB
VQCGVEGRDLGGVAADIQRAIDTLPDLPPGTRVHIRGQSESMNSSFASLGLGLVLAAALVYMLMVVLFQSWIDPLIIMVAVPGALTGVLCMLALTGTTLNVESLMGTIMAVGVAVSNSILMVSFANEVREERPMSAVAAALEAGKTRLRPVLMTALAMILGMLPMALAMGEGGEQNAPLGRAVIGGLLVATAVTLFIVPVVYSLLRVRAPNKGQLDAAFTAEAHGHA